MGVKARKTEGDEAWVIFCPACGNGHRFTCSPGTNGAGGQRPVWTFNGDVERPTFRASMLVRGQRYPSGNAFPTDDEHERMMKGEKLAMQPHVCHSFVTDGRIEFLSDCTHAMAGQTVDLPDF